MRIGLILALTFWAVIYLNGCANWQGIDFHVGVGSYNGAQETKSYTPEKEKGK